MSTQMSRSVLGWVISAGLVLSCSVDGERDGEREPATGERASQAQAQALVHGAVSCAAEPDCAGGLACVAGACQPCSAHGQCQSDVCDQGAATSMGPGACVPEAAVIYVDTRARPACATGDGSRTSPVCEIRDGILRAIGSKYTLRVAPGRYRPFSSTDRTYHVFGPGDGSAIVGEEDLSAGARITGSSWSSQVVIDGLDFGVSVLTGVICNGANLKVLRGAVQGDFDGITATNCQLEIDRVRAAGRGRSGLTIAGTGAYRITNSYFGGSDRQAVVFSGSSAGTFEFNTVTGGGELRPGGIDCGTTSREIRDSIVIGSFPAARGAQTVGACVHQRVVVGSGDTRPDPGLIPIDPDLDPQGRLLDTPADAACCIDRGARYVSSLCHDFFGTLRPQGPSNDIGAHELVR